jgi:CrcB protein
VLLPLQATGGDDATADEEAEDDELLEHGAECTDRRRECFRERTVTVSQSAEIDPELSLPIARPSFTVIAATFAGGFLGTLARYGFDLGWPEHDGAIPHTTNVINTTGAFAIGVVATILARTSPERRRMRAFLITGLLGGWTTMSAVAVADVRLASHEGSVITVVAMLCSLLAGAVAAWGGVVCTNRVGRARKEHSG